MKFLPGKRTIMVLLAVAAVMLLPLAAIGNTVLSGTLTSPTASGVTATDGWDSGGFSIAWNIFADGTYQGFINYDYTYTITVTGPQTRDISHLILEVSPGAVAADFRDATPGFEIGTYDGSQGNSNPNMPATIYGLKFSPAAPPEEQSTDIYTIHFDSVRSPVWGSFYAKDGVFNPGQIDVTAWNTGLAGGSAFIGVPDTQVFIPIPPSVYLMGSGLLGLGLIGWRRRSQR